MEKYIDKAKKEKKVNIPVVDEKLYPIFFRLAFVRKLTKNKKLLGVDHYYILDSRTRGIESGEMGYKDIEFFKD